MADDRRTGERVNLTLPPEVVRVLDRLSAASGQGRATIVRELLTDALPQLSQMALAIEMAKRKNVDAFKVLADTMHAVGVQASQLELDIRSQRRKAMRKRAK